ncbi:MAG: threonine/serine exporter [Ruminococcaceae bacterium]|nr:threonine/serine exporter [Oscillospiraceae bacterium]
MKEIAVQLTAAFLGSLGFSLVFGLHRRYLFAASAGGAMAWGVFLAAQAWLGTDFLPCLIASAFAVLYSELMARRLKTPATLFAIPSVLPLLPGGSLYYAMSHAVRGELDEARAFGTKTLLYALAIAAGISIVVAFRALREKR